MTELKNLTKIYRSGERETVALDHIDCAFGERGLVFLLGKSGSGKTTLLNLLGGLDEPTSGELIVNGKSVRAFTQADFDDYRSRRVGFVFQEYRLLSEYTVGENVGIALELLGEKADKEKIDAVLKRVGLSDIVSTELSTLFSYGERMILAEAPWATDGNVFNRSLLSALESVSASEPLLACEFRFPLPSPTAFYNLLGDGAFEAAFLAGFSDPYHYVGVSDMDCAVELEDANSARLLPDPRFADPSLCRAPRSPDEIALSDLRADMLLEFGFRESEDAPLTRCRSVDELVGKKIGALTICGVYATESEKTYFEERRNVNYSSLASNDELYLRAESAARRSVLSFAYVCKGFHAAYGLSPLGMFFEAEGSAKRVAGVLNGLSFREGSTGKKYAVALDTAVSRFMPFEGTVELIAAIGGGAGALFCAVGGLMTLHFMSVSVEFRKKELAVLRALGAKRREIVGICATEGGILALGELLLAVAVLFAVSATANAYCKALLFLPGLSEIGAILLLCLSLSAAATALPAYRVAKASPAAALRTV